MSFTEEEIDGLSVRGYRPSAQENLKLTGRRLRAEERRVRFYKRAFIITISLLIVSLLLQCGAGSSSLGLTAARAADVDSSAGDAATANENLKPAVEKSRTLTAGEGAALPDALPSDPVMRAKLAAAQNYIASVNRHVDAAHVAYLFVSTSWKARMDPPANFWLFVAIAADDGGRESSFYVDCLGGAGERGLLQVHPNHRDSMRRMGLDYDKEPDRLMWAAIHIRQQLAKGHSLYHALLPWRARRDQALRLFRRLTDGEV